MIDETDESLCATVSVIPRIEIRIHNEEDVAEALHANVNMTQKQLRVLRTMGQLACHDTRYQSVLYRQLGDQKPPTTHGSASTIDYVPYVQHAIRRRPYVKVEVCDEGHIPRRRRPLCDDLVLLDPAPIAGNVKGEILFPVRNLNWNEIGDYFR